MNTRAYSTIEIKSTQDVGGKRTFKGIASTPSVDRMGDIVEPMGMQIKLPCPLLWQHDSGEPIGWVTAAKATKSGIEVECEVASIEEAGTLKDRLDEAWQSLKAKLVRGLSIGFNALESARIEGTYGYRFLSWEMLELSAVTVPANQDCSITTIKSIDQEQRRAASGAKSKAGVVHLKSEPGASGKKPPLITPKGNDMNIREQIASFEAKRASSADRMSAIMTKAAEEGRTLDEQETQEYDGLQAEVKSVDDHLVRLKSHEATVVAKATEVSRTVVVDQKSASEARGVEIGNGTIRVESRLEKGIPFVRYMKALVQARGIPHLAAQIADANAEWRKSSPEVAMVLKAAVAAGDTTTAGWASELVYNQNITSAFLEYLRPRTILGKIQGMTPVPFNVRWGTQTGGATGYWVGQGSPTPVSKLSTGSDSLGIAKAAGLVVLDKELIMSASPSAELLVRNDLANTIAQFLDVNFIAPDYAAVANVNPASITNGVEPTAASGTAAANLRTDAQNLFANFDTNNLEGPDFVWITTPKVARAMSLMVTSLGEPFYPTVTPFGGTFMGYPLIVSLSSMQVGSPVTNEGNLLVLVHAPSIAMADEGGLTIDASEEAAIQMLDNPTNTSTGSTTATTMVSMFQTNSVALRATRFINWKKRRTFAVQYIKDANYTS
jgi:HK97 family phage major capsid protein/HK97 family phage prohead protease